MSEESLIRNSHLAFLKAPTDLFRSNLNFPSEEEDLQDLYLANAISRFQKSLKSSLDIQGSDLLTLQTLVGM